jgi:hypothetical protein
MRTWAWVLGAFVVSRAALACGDSSGDDGNDGGDNGGSNTGGSGASGGTIASGGTSGATGGSIAGGGTSGATGGSTPSGGTSGAMGGSMPTGGSGGGTGNPLCDAYAEEFDMECPQNGSYEDARGLCQEGFDQYSPRGCESEWGDLIVCATEGTYDCLSGMVAGCDATLDALMACLE